MSMAVCRLLQPWQNGWMDRDVTWHDDDDDNDFVTIEGISRKLTVDLV